MADAPEGSELGDDRARAGGPDESRARGGSAAGDRDGGPGRITLVGTAHVSAESAREVEETIRRERPDVVAVELDEGRYRQLQGETPDDLDAGDLLKGNTVFQFLAYWMLSYVQTQLGERFDVEPGADMLAAVETAEELGLGVALVDRDIQTTIQRFWARMTPVEKLRMIGGLAFGVSDSRAAGVVAGLLAGVVLGPAIALFGGAVGITAGPLTRAAGSVLVGAAVTLVAARLGRGRLDADTRLFAAVGVGLAATGIAAASGAVDGLVAGLLGDTAIRTIGGLGIGIAGGLTAGLAASAVLALASDPVPDADGIDDLAVEDLTDADVVTMMMEEFRQFSPGGAEALIDERDAYIAHELLALRGAGHHVVAAVGAGHRRGIERHLDDPASLPPMESLVGRETGRRLPWLKIAGGLLSVGFVGFFLLLAMAGVRNAFLLRLFGAWFLVNAAFAFAFAKLAGARWSSAGVGGAVAWLTSINPALAPGWFAGYMELRHLTVNVADIGRLNDLLSDTDRPIGGLVSEMFDVPLFRLIMVVALTNIGSILATFLFLLYVLPLFGAELGGVDGISRLMFEGARNSAELVWRAVA